MKTLCRTVRLLLTAALAAWGASGPAPAAVVTERWGAAALGARTGAPGSTPHVQHPRALLYEALPAGAGTLLRFDLSALPKGTKVYRARLFFSRPKGYASGFDAVPARRGDDGRVAPAGARLKLVGPYYRWFDAAEVVARAVRQGEPHRGEPTVLLLLRKAPTFDSRATFLEIAYEGHLRKRLRQVSDVKAFCRGGQVFITFKEIEDLARGQGDLSWGEFAKRVVGYGVEGPIADDRRRELRYRVYRHDRAITRASIGDARLLADVVAGSGYNTRLAPPQWEWEKKKPPVLRLAVEPGKCLPPGVGLYVHTPARKGRGYYAVVTALNGVENTIDVTPANAVGPVEEEPAQPEAVLNREVATDLDGTKYVRQWYSLWAVQPLAPRPMRYDLTVEFCPQLLPRLPRLVVSRGHAWGLNPEPGRPAKLKDVRLSHSEDEPNSFWMGLNDAWGTLKGIEEGRWQPFTQRRQEFLVRWACEKWRCDPRRTVAAIGAWGMMEIERGDLYAYLVGWGQPEVTRGFQCWERALSVWGPPGAYADRPPGEDPFRRQDYSSYVMDHPEKELPYFLVMAGWGMHLSEMGWPALPRFFHAMVETKRAFVASWDQTNSWSWRPTPVHRAVGARQIRIRRQQSLPAFRHCSLDDNPGSGKPGSGDVNGQINGYLLWETHSIVDEPDRWAMTIWLDESAPRPECTADLTPRRCERFKSAPGEKLNWTNAAAGEDEILQAGRAVADEHGLVTIERLAVGKGKHRITIRRQAPPPAEKDTPR